MKYLLHCTLAALLICSAQAQNIVPPLLSYQGQVLDSAGAAVGTTTPVNRTVTFRVWNHASNILDANLLYSEQQTVTIANGDFSVLVGQGIATAGTPLGFSETLKGPTTLNITNVFTGHPNYYLGVTVDDGTAAVDNEITPRQQIVTAAFAFRSKTADTVTAASGSTSNFTGATVTGGTFNGGTFATGTFSGTGTGLTSLNATSVASGTLADARLSPNVALLDRTQTFTGAANVFQNVGIGTNPGAFKLNVNGTVNTGALTGASLASTGTVTAAAASGYVFGAGGDTDGGLFSPLDGVITIKTNTSERLRVDASGNVGIGTATPGFALDVSRSTGAGSDTAGVHIATTVAGDTLGPSLRLTHSGTGGRNYGIYSTGAGNAGGAGLLQFYDLAAGASRMVIDPSGNVGIGTMTPAVKLHVAGGTDASLTNGSGIMVIGSQTATNIVFDDNEIESRNNGAASDLYINTDGGAVAIGNGDPGIRAKFEVFGEAGMNFIGPAWGAYYNSGFFGDPNYASAASIYASNEVVAETFLAVSDERIKSISGRSDTAADLSLLRTIEVTDYHYKDVVAKGSAPHKKVVAQQVEKVFPQAVSRRTDVVPDIYQKATIKDGWVQLATDLKKGERVRLIAEKKEGIHEVLEVAEGKFRTDFAPENDKIFVYGREVKDFRTVDYEAISMLNVSATQELARQLEEQKKENAALKERLAALEAKDQARDAKLTAIERMLSGEDARAVVTRQRGK